MDFELIKKLVEDNYNIKVEDVIKRKNVYRIKSGFIDFCLKVINYDFEHFNFIISAINHLECNGFTNTPKIILTSDNKKYIKLEEKYAYLTKWIDAREADYDNDYDLKEAANRLRKLHICSKGFILNDNMRPRIGWGTWIRVFETRAKEILDFKKRIGQKFYKSEFDIKYLGVMDDELRRVESSINHIKESNYINYMQNELKSLGFCHHDYANHNVLIGKDGVGNIIDYDYCILDSHLHDLSSLLVRAMKDGKWSLERFDFIKNSYSEEVSKEEEKIMLGFIEFPQAYWQVGLQYYWEQLPWNEERFLGRLNSYIDDRENRQEFINSLEGRR